jgi:hypothetical protein
MTLANASAEAVVSALSAAQSAHLTFDLILR